MADQAKLTAELKRAAAMTAGMAVPAPADAASFITMVAARSTQHTTTPVTAQRPPWRG